LAVGWMAGPAGRLVRGRRVQAQTDSQAGEGCIRGQKGKGQCLGWGAELYRICFEADAEVEAAGYPRTVAEQREADARSKEVDRLKWALAPDLYARAVAQGVLRGRHPDAGRFANSVTVKVAGAFDAARWSPGCRGVDAMAQDGASRRGGGGSCCTCIRRYGW
jgi:hypothetical protein